MGFRLRAVSLVIVLLSVMLVQNTGLSFNAPSPTKMHSPASIEEFRKLTDTSGGYPTWDSDMINVRDFQGQDVGYTGKGVYVAVLDTGLVPNWRDYFPTARIRDDLGRGFIENLYVDQFGLLESTGIVHESSDIGDLGSSHGTHVVSTITGYFYDVPTDNIPPIVVRGIAPGATIIPVKVLETYHFPGTGSEGVTLGTGKSVAAGIQYATQLKLAGYSPMVVSMSLGSILPNYEVEEAINDAINNGVIIVAAAGNLGPVNGMTFPASFPQVISVGASGWTYEWFFANHGMPGRGTLGNKLWWLQSDLAPYNDIPENANLDQTYVSFFSSREIHPWLQWFPAQLDVLAPGSWVRGPFPIGAGYSHLPWWSQGEGWAKNHANQGNFFFVGGTSMATSHVSSVAALILEKAPDLHQSDVELILKSTALDIPRGDRQFFDVTNYNFEGIARKMVYVWWEKTFLRDEATGAGLVQADAALKATPLHANAAPLPTLSPLPQVSADQLAARPRQIIPNPTPPNAPFGPPRSPDNFGISIAALGDDILVGSNQDSTFSYDDGAVYQFDGHTGNLTRIYKNPTPANIDPYANPSDPAKNAGDLFGVSIATLGDKVLIGADLDNTAAVRAGAAYVFNGTSGQLIQTILDPDTSAWDLFGRQIVTVGQNFAVAAVGTGGHDRAGIPFYYGSVHLFDGATGKLLRTFREAGPYPSGFFGLGMAASGGDLLVSSFFGDRPGAVYLFDTSTGQLLHTFQGPGRENGDWFGMSMAVDGGYILISAPRDNTLWPLAGAVYVYDATSYQLVRVLLNPVPAVDFFGGVYFGWSLAALNGKAYVGAPRSGFGGNVFVFDIASGDLSAVISDPFPKSGDFFGEYIARVGNDVAISALDDDGETRGSIVSYFMGTVYVYKTIGQPTAGSSQQEASSPPAGTDNPPTENLNPTVSRYGAYSLEWGLVTGTTPLPLSTPEEFDSGPQPMQPYFPAPVPTPSTLEPLTPRQPHAIPA